MRTLILLTLLTAASLTADIADSSANGFTVKFSIPIQSAPADVYTALLQVGNWWNPAHSFSGDSHNLSIDARPGGCFCEKLPNQGGVRHMEVVNVTPGKRLVLSGALGPLQSIAASGSMTFQISPAENGSKLDVTYTVAGYLPAGMNTWAAPVDGVLKEQLARLKNFAEHGKP